MKLETTFGSFLLKHQQEHNRTLNFLILMESIVSAAKQIRQAYLTGALEQVLGEVGCTNVQGESVMKLDLAAHNILLHYLKESNQVIEVTSEEVTEEIVLNEDGRYFVYFDPLDGSGNVRSSLPVGAMFGIAKRNLDGPEDYHLRPGNDYIAAGMFLIPSGDFTFALRGAGTWRFYMDATQTYVRPTRVILPKSKKTQQLAWNAGNRYYFSEKVQKWLTDNERDFGFRYGGALAVDFHRLLHDGGMFLYPALINHPKPEKNRPEGKLRLMYEANVAALLAVEAGGAAIDENGNDILSIKPFKRHQRTALYVGNSEAVESMRKTLKA